MNPILFPITYKCNLNCKYCTMKDRTAEPDIDKCMDLIRNSDEEWVFITGGEPLLVENINDICAEIKTYGKKIGLTTNGTIENNDINLFVDRLGVSIDGNTEYHNTYRDGSFQTALNFLESQIGKVETVLMFTEFEENRQHEDYIIELGRSIGVDNIQITRGTV